MDTLVSDPALLPPPPPHWQEDRFTHPDTKHDIRWGCSIPPQAEQTIILLGGLSEFAEKYFEVMADLNARGIGVYTMDWAYQGLSSRHPDNPHKRHSDGYDTDIADLDYFIRQIVKPESKQIPMMGHSMGGHMALRYAYEHPDVVEKLILTSPMLGIKLPMPYILAKTLAQNLCNMKNRCWTTAGLVLETGPDAYIPGGSDWSPRTRNEHGIDEFSSSTTRNRRHNALCEQNKDLQVGSPTTTWLYNSFLSCEFMACAQRLKTIETPTLLCMAAADTIVDNKAILHASAHLPHCRLLKIEDARHEILMERDIFRDQFWQAFDSFIKDLETGPKSGHPRHQHLTV